MRKKALVRKLVDITFTDKPVKKRGVDFDVKKFSRLADEARKTFSDEDLLRFKPHYWAW